MQTLAPLPAVGSITDSFVTDRIAPASAVSRKPNRIRLSRLSVPAMPAGGNVLAAMDRSATSLAAIPAPQRRARPKKLPKPVRTGPTTIQMVGKVIGQVGKAAGATGKALGKAGKKTLNVIERSSEGFD